MAQGNAEGYTPAALSYFESHAVTPAVAFSLGVGEVGDCLIFPEGRERSLNGAGPKVRQPAGQPLAPWKIVDHGSTVLVCEGESDGLAARSASEGGLSIIAVPGTGCPVDRVADAVQGASLVYVATDADEAGHAYAAKLGEALTEAGIEARRVQLPEGSDLADVLAGTEPEARGAKLAELLQTAVDPRGPAPDAAELLAEVEAFIRRFVILPSDAALTLLTVFVAHTWAFDAADASPYVLVVSPEKRSGKTRLLEVLMLLVRRPWPTTGPSPTALYRTLADRQSTLLLDELDALLAGNGERTEGIREVLNTGNRPGFPVPRFNASRGEIEHFECFSPKVLAGIDTGHRIPDTVRDRGLTVHMQRKTGAESVERLRLRDVKPQAAPLRQRFERWAEAHLDELRGAEPELPPELNDRLADGAEPLLAIAELAGDAWLGRTRAAILALADDDDDDTALGALLLAALRDAFGDAARMRTSELLECVNADETLPFGGFGDAGLDSRGLARLLKPYGIRPKSVRIGDDANHRGYERDQFRDAWNRWSPHAPECPPQAPQAPHTTSTATQKPLEQADVVDVVDVADNPARAQLVADRKHNGDAEGGCASHPDGAVPNCRYCRESQADRSVNNC